MKLLVCATEYYPYGAGIANMAYNVVSQLQGMGVDCTVCSPTGPDIKLGSSSMIARFGCLGMLYYWHQVGKYFKQRAINYDVVWLHYPLLLGGNPFNKYVITIHSTAYGMIYPSFYYIYKKFSSSIESYCLNRLSSQMKYIGVSHKSCKEFQTITRGRKEITFIPNGVDIKRFKPTEEKEHLRAKFNIPIHATVLLSVGRLVYHKMPFTLIDIFDKIQKPYGNYMLVVAGKGELFEQAKEYVTKNNIDNIKFLGFVSDNDLPDLYACSDLFIITSKYEGGEPTLTLAEAMACGLPCIVSDIPNFRIVKDADCGIVVDFGDVEQAVERVVYYLNGKRAEHSRNARKYAVENLDWKIIARRYLEEFESLSGMAAKG